jgi:excisionase family DNA binding protein
METASNILTIREVAEILRCSKAHVQKAMLGRIVGVPHLTHLTMGRRKLIRKEWLEQWMEANKTQ